jgi:PKD repeat protein
VFAALNSTNLCIGAFVVLQAPINNFYLWNNGETSRQIVATTAGTYTVQVGNAANCLSVASDGLVVTETGLPCTGASGPTVANVNRCGPGSITITASGATGGQVYRWYDAPTGGTLLNTGNPYSPTIAATTPFYVSIFDPGNSTETNRSAVTATVVSIITPTINPGNVSICEGSTTLLSGPTGFVQYLWSNNATTQQIPVSDNGTFTLQAGDGTCLSASSAPVTVTKVPAIAKPVITAVGSTALCGSSSVTLRAPTGFSSYTWSTGSTLAEITVSSAGNYTVVVGNGTCTSPTSDAINVTAVTIPSQPTIAVTGSTALCNGAFVVLTAPASFSNYVWNNGETTRQIVVTVAGSYFVQTGNSATCLSVVSASVVVTETGQSCGGAATPEANFIASIVCQGQATSFSDLSINLGNNPTYAWDFDGDGSTESTTVGNVTYIYSSYGSYNATLKITLEGGSIITRTRTVDVNAVPVVAFTSNTLCLGAATVFTDNSTNVLASATYSWDFNNDGSEDSAVKGNTSFAYAAAGNYSASLRIDNQNGCSTQRIFPVTVNRAPLTQLVEIDGGASPQLCSGVSILLKVTPEAGVTYQWKRNTVNVGTNQPEFTVNTSGTYSVTLTNTCGTINAINTITTVTVPTPLAATITTTGSTSLCAGESLLLSVPFSSGIQYQWKRDNSLITDATATVLLATEGGSYTLVSENSCGSVESVPFIVTGLAAAPSIPTIGYTGNLTLCSPEQVELHIPAVSNVTYTWRRNGIDLSLNQNSIMVDQAGVYTLQLSNACRTVLSSNSLQVIVNQKPLAQLISANRAPIICPGEVVLLAVTPELGVTYQWQLNNNPVGSNAAQVSATDAGTYRLKLTNTCGEIFSSNTIALNVIATPSAPVITAGSETTICENQTVALTIPALAGVSYSWLKDNSPINFTNSNTFIASQAGTYTVKVNNGCTEVSGANSIAVTLLPRAPLTQSIQIVSGASVFCTPGQVELGVAQEVGVSYQWLVNGIATGTNKNTLITSAAGVYTVQMFNDCRTVQSINSVTVSVLDKPLQQNIQASRSTDLCLGESVQLSVPLEASVSYQWIRNGIVLTGEISSTTAAVDAGEYQVKMSNGCGDRLSDIRLVTVLSTPASASIEPKSSLNFCQGGNVILSVPFVAGQTYQWKKDGLNFATTFEVLAQESGSYTVEIGNRCYSNSSIIPVTVTEFSNPEQPIIDAFLEDECDKRTYELTARGTFVSYQWFIGTSRLVSTNSATYFPVATGVYKVRGTDSNGCSSDSEPYNVDISSPRTPIIISQGDPDSLLTTDVVADKFQWYVNNKFIVGANQRQINVFYNGEYKVRVTYEDGCRVFSTGYSLNEEGYNKYGRFATFPSDTSIVLPERKFDDLIEVTPNPTKGMVKVTYFGSPTEGTVCAVYNQLGVAIRQGTMVKRFGYLQLEFDLSDMEGGLYLIKLSSPFSSITQRIIKL